MKKVENHWSTSTQQMKEVWGTEEMITVTKAEVTKTLHDLHTVSPGRQFYLAVQIEGDKIKTGMGSAESSLRLKKKKTHACWSGSVSCS